MDSLETVREATALADWVALHERRLTTIYITHGHADHDLGLMASGDVAYNHCHMYVGATTADIRAEWIAASTSWRRSTPPPSPVTRIRPAAIHPRSWPSPAATSNTADSSARRPCPIGSCSTLW